MKYLFKISKLILFLGIILLFYGYGLITDKYKIFPYGYIRDIQKEAVTVINQEKNKEIAKVYSVQLNEIVEKNDVIKLAKIKNTNDIVIKRDFLIDRVYGNNEILYSALPHEIIKDFNFEDFNYYYKTSDLYKIKPKIQKITSKLKHDYILDNYFFYNDNVSRNDKLIIFVNEYRNFDKNFILIDNKSNLFAEYLKNGFDVLLVSNPLEGWNRFDRSPVSYQTNDYNTITGQFESSLRFSLLENDSFSPLNYFLQPVSEALNYLTNEKKYSDIYMMGTGPGGWTTTLYSAMDERIKYSISASGTLPLYSRGIFMDDFGHWEYYASDIYKKIGYLDIYTLASFGDNRKHVQAYNEFNTYCYWGFKAEHYKKAMNDLKNKFNVNFELFIHKNGRIHEKLANTTLNLEKINYFFNS